MSEIQVQNSFTTIVIGESDARQHCRVNTVCQGKMKSWYWYWADDDGLHFMMIATNPTKPHKLAMECCIPCATEIAGRAVKGEP